MEKIKEEDYKIITKKEFKELYKKIYCGERITIKRFKDYLYIYEEKEFFDFEKDVFFENTYITNKYKVKI